MQYCIKNFLLLGDAVTFLAERSPVDCPTKWVAKQVLINEETAGLLQTAKTNPIQKDEAVLMQTFKIVLIIDYFQY